MSKTHLWKAYIGVSLGFTGIVNGEPQFPYRLENIHYRAVIVEQTVPAEQFGFEVKVGTEIEGWHLGDQAVIAITNGGLKETFLSSRGYLLPKYGAPKSWGGASKSAAGLLIGNGSNNGSSFASSFSPLAVLWCMFDDQKLQGGSVGTSAESGFYKASIEWDAPNGWPLSETVEVLSERPLRIQFDAAMIAVGAQNPYTPTCTILFEGECSENHTGLPFPARATTIAYPADMSTREVGRFVVEYQMVQPATESAGEVFDRESREQAILEPNQRYDYEKQQVVSIAHQSSDGLTTQNQFNPRAILAVGGGVLIILGMALRRKKA